MDSLDSLHPDRLRCDRCGWAAPDALDLTDDPAERRCLTEDEATACWPDLAGHLRLHGILCPPARLADPGAAEMVAGLR
jgi:hypothetical protein